MKNSTRFIIVILLLVLSWWLQNLLDTKPELITREKTRFANYFLEDFTITSHNDAGQVKYTLSANRLDNFEEEDTAELKQIKVSFYGDKENWTLTAGKGRIHHKSQQIDFYDGVNIYRPASANKPEISIETTEIKFDSKLDLLKTKQKVFIRSGKSQFQSTGLSFNNKLGTLELESNVKGHYEK